jgi:uncharacterized protein YjbI with pentapeptide repeats
MANEEHLQRLKEGASAWNTWRLANPKIIINLSQANLRGANFRGADLSGVDLSGADLRGARFWLTNLSGSNLSQVNLSGADLRGADLRGADLSGQDLSSANLTGQSLRGSLRRTDLRGANLTGANLSQVNFRGADLSGLDLKGTNLSGADLSGADLRGANLTGANLSRAHLDGTSLIDTNLDGATLTDTCLWEIQRAGWSIRGIVCEAVYWDKDKKERTTYSPREFERLYANKTKVVLQYAGGIISPIEVATLPSMIEIMQKWSSCVLRLDSLQDAPGGATVTLVIEDPGKRNADQTATLQAELKSLGQRAIELQRELLHEREGRLRAEGALNFVSNFFSPLMERITGQSPGIQIHISGGTIHGNIAGNVSGENSEVNYYTKHPEGDTEA